VREFVPPFPGRASTRAATPYSALDLIQIQEKFRPTAEKYRKRTWIMYLALGGMLIIIAGLLLFNGMSLLIFNHTLVGSKVGTAINVLAILSGLAGLAIRTSLPLLRCPGCKGFLDQGVARFCPQCGSDDLLGLDGQSELQ
jgi:hypothetical protein